MSETNTAWPSTRRRSRLKRDFSGNATDIGFVRVAAYGPRYVKSESSAKPRQNQR